MRQDDRCGLILKVSVNQRLEFGHWEMDLVVGCSGSRAALLTLTERQTRQELIYKLPDKRAASVRAVFDKLERDMGRKKFRERFKSITTDNGPEFLEYDKLRQSIRDGPRFDIYYCHSYSAWEKGTNENHNRMIRRWFPNFFGSIVDGIAGIFEAILGKLLDALTALSEMLMGKVKDVVEVVLSIFDELPQLFGGFLDFLGIVFPFLPSEITLLLTFGVIAVVFIGIIKAIRR